MKTGLHGNEGTGRGCDFTILEFFDESRISCSLRNSERDWAMVRTSGADPLNLAQFPCLYRTWMNCPGFNNIPPDVEVVNALGGLRDIFKQQLDRDPRPSEVAAMLDCLGIGSQCGNPGELPPKGWADAMEGADPCDIMVDGELDSYDLTVELGNSCTVGTRRVCLTRRLRKSWS